MTQNRRYYEDIKEVRDSVTSTSTTSEWTQDDYEMLQKYYEENLGCKMPRPITQLAADAARAGMLLETVLQAIDETMFAPRPSPHYFRAILLRWINAGILTPAHVAADREQFGLRKATRRAGFTQRDTSTYADFKFTEIPEDV